MNNNLGIPEEIKLLIVRYLSDDLIEGDALKLQEWVKASDENLLLLKEITKIWKASNLLPNEDFDAQQAWTEISGRLKTKSRRNFSIRYLYKYAAIAVVLLAIGTLVNYYLQQDSSIVEQMNEVTAPLGSHTSITLADGSKVVLNAGSSLKYEASFGKVNRNVYLEGEAWFEVEKNQRMAFVVHSAGMKVKVLGTSFVVSSYPDDHEIHTFLEHGSIELQIDSINKKLIVAPGEQAVYNKKSHQLTVDKNFDPNIGSWRFGGLSFYREPFEQIARKLERRFCVKFRFEDKKLSEMQLTAEFENVDIDQITKYLSVVANVKIEKKNDTFLISAK